MMLRVFTATVFGVVAIVALVAAYAAVFQGEWTRAAVLWGWAFGLTAAAVLVVGIPEEEGDPGDVR